MTELLIHHQPKIVGNSPFFCMMILVVYLLIGQIIWHFSTGSSFVVFSLWNSIFGRGLEAPIFFFFEETP